MGQKVKPTGFRLGIMEGWRSRWYAGKGEYSDLLMEDFKVRNFIKKKYKRSGISKIEIERTPGASTTPSGMAGSCNGNGPDGLRSCLGLPSWL